MYENIAVLALFALIYSLLAGKVERSILSGPLVFVLFGVAAGPVGLGILDLDVGRGDLRTVADLTLAMVLFIDAANADLFSERFLVKRPLLQAIDAAEEKPPVLLIDELDRSDEEFEGFLLELLSDYQITIPELGTYKAVHPPIVIITSNRTREIHDALKRRCLYYWVDYPDYQKELQIITARIPEAPRKLAEQVTAFIQEMRETELFKIPGVSETLDWLSALLALNQTELDPAVIDDTLGMMLKYQDDIESVKGEPVRAMMERSRNRGPRRGGRRRG